MKRFFSASPIGQAGGLALIRIILGAFLIYHGWEVFSAATMNGYQGWDMFKTSSFGKILVYAGKAAELVAGILFVLGWLTRVAVLLTVGTMLYITFFVGHGKFWYEDQYPFLFVLLALVFFFTGPGTESVDNLISKKNK
jgi:putative oxidoreductase